MIIASSERKCTRIFYCIHAKGPWLQIMPVQGKTCSGKQTGPQIPITTHENKLVNDLPCIALFWTHADADLEQLPDHDGTRSTNDYKNPHNCQLPT